MLSSYQLCCFISKPWYTRILFQHILQDLLFILMCISPMINEAVASFIDLLVSCISPSETVFPGALVGS